jgi:hypothetical protein
MRNALEWFVGLALLAVVGLIAHVTLAEDPKPAPAPVTPVTPAKPDLDPGPCPNDKCARPRPRVKWQEEGVLRVGSQPSRGRAPFRWRATTNDSGRPSIWRRVKPGRCPVIHNRAPRVTCDPADPRQIGPGSRSPTYGRSPGRELFNEQTHRVARARRAQSPPGVVRPGPRAVTRTDRADRRCPQAGRPGQARGDSPRRHDPDRASIRRRCEAAGLDRDRRVGARRPRRAGRQGRREARHRPGRPAGPIGEGPLPPGAGGAAPQRTSQLRSSWVFDQRL